MNMQLLGVNLLVQNVNMTTLVQTEMIEIFALY